MNEEQIIEIDETNDQLVHEAIKQDCGICKHLYHGTSIYNAQKIKRTNEIKIPNEVGYLGKGFYCYHLDIEASRIWAREKNEEGKIGVLNLVANLGNTFFVSKELYQIFRDKSKTLRDCKLDIDKKIGNYIELFIKGFLKPIYGININTVGRFYNYKQNRPALMYSIRDKIMVKNIELCWEEQ